MSARRPAPRRRSAPRGRSRPARSSLWLFVLGALVGAGALYLALRDSPSSDRTAGPQPAAAATASDAAPGAAGERAVSPAPAASLPVSAPAGVSDLGRSAGDTDAEAPRAGGAGGRIALVIDDLGRDMAEIEAIASLGVPVSYAVLPYEEQTPEVVAELRRRGAEILLHLPMEPTDGEKDPGPGALRLGMSPDQLRDLTAAALREVPGAVGVNNHMGSGLSADERSMGTILRVLSSRGMFFLDSRTSPRSVGYQVASRLGLPTAERQVFLDSEPEPEEIRHQFQRLLGLARSRGAAVAIGHPLPDTLAVLAEEVPKAKAQGYEFVPVSYLVDRMNLPEEPEE